MRERGRIRGGIIDDGEMGNDGLFRPLGGFVVFHFLTRFIIHSKNSLELFVCSFAWDGRGILKRCHFSCSSEEFVLPFLCD